MAKRNAQGSGSIRQRSNGRWEARVTVGTNPGTGKPERRSIYGATQKEVRQRMTEIINAIDKGTYQKPSKMTVALWLQEWLDTYAANKVKPLTLSSYQGIIRNHINPQIGAVELQAAHAHRVECGVDARCSFLLLKIAP